MRFDLVATDSQGFEDWVEKTRSSGGKLDTQSYDQLARPSTAVAPMTFGDVVPGLFERLTMADRPALATADAGQKICSAMRKRN